MVLLALDKRRASHIRLLYLILRFGSILHELNIDSYVFIIDFTLEIDIQNN